MKTPSQVATLNGATKLSLPLVAFERLDRNGVAVIDMQDVGWGRDVHFRGTSSRSSVPCFPIVKRAAYVQFSQVRQLPDQSVRKPDEFVVVEVPATIVGKQDGKINDCLGATETDEF